MMENTLRQRAFSGLIKTNLKVEKAILRLLLYHGEVCRLPSIFNNIRVLSGMAWVSVTRKDIILTQGETLSGRSRRNWPALVSSLGETPLIIEIE